MPPREATSTPTPTGRRSALALSAIANIGGKEMAESLAPVRCAIMRAGKRIALKTHTHTHTACTDLSSARYRTLVAFDCTNRLCTPSASRPRRSDDGCGAPEQFDRLRRQLGASALGAALHDDERHRLLRSAARRVTSQTRCSRDTHTHIHIHTP